eukprot:5550897-Pyramimonas_sp.AAC.1
MAQHRKSVRRDVDCTVTVESTIKTRVCTSVTVPSPGVDGQTGLRLQFNSRQSSTVDTIIPFSARHFEYSIEYSTYVPCRQTAIGWPTVDSGAWTVPADLMKVRHRHHVVASFGEHRHPLLVVRGAVVVHLWEGAIHIRGR